MVTKKAGYCKGRTIGVYHLFLIILALRMIDQVLKLLKNRQRQVLFLTNEIAVVDAVIIFGEDVGSYKDEHVEDVECIVRQSAKLS